MCSLPRSKYQISNNSTSSYALRIYPKHHKDPAKHLNAGEREHADDYFEKVCEHEDMTRVERPFQQFIDSICYREMQKYPG